MRILVTGGSGLLGSRISEIAVNQGHEVYSTYNTHYSPHGIPIKMNLMDEGSCRRAFQKANPEIVIHCAALTNVDLCEIDKDMAWKINVQGTRKIAELCKRHGCFLIFISTDYVFDGVKGLYSEADKPSPINYYGYTKLKAEEVVKETLRDYCIARTSVIFGSRPAAGKINFALWVLKSLKSGKRVNIVIDQVNSPTLNSNLTNMLLEVAERRLTGIYHLAGSTPISRYDFAMLLAQEFKLNKELIQPTTSDKIDWVARRPKNTSLDVTKASDILNNKPINIREAVRELRKELESYR